MSFHKPNSLFFHPKILLMRFHKYPLFFILLSAFCSLACLWDYDTLAMEKQKFPSVVELIAGKFLRHSPEFYQWRIEDRLEKLKTDSSRWEWYDDLAVAYDKIGNSEKAIEILLRKNKKNPNQYTTLANLGTAFIHNGQLKEGAEYIRQAIAINPEAHFGREKIQLYLVEFLINKVKQGKIQLPYKGNFGSYLSSKNISNEEGIIGILGMMKFGKYDAPILLQALGDLLGGGRVNPKRTNENYGHLASRAYLKAALEIKDSLAQKAYFKLAQRKVDIQYEGGKRGGAELTMPKLEYQLRREIKEGEDFYNQIKKDELSWIEKGINPEEAFEKKYYQSPELSNTTYKRKVAVGKLEDAVRKVKTKEKAAWFDLRPVLSSNSSSSVEIEAATKLKIEEEPFLEEKRLTNEIPPDQTNKPNTSRKISFTYLIWILVPMCLIFLLFGLKKIAKK